MRRDVTACGNLCSTLHAGGADEEGLDQGGVKKEFFQLLTREIFNEVSDGPRPMSCPSHGNNASGESMYSWLQPV